MAELTNYLREHFFESISLDRKILEENKIKKLLLEIQKCLDNSNTNTKYYLGETVLFELFKYRKKKSSKQYQLAKKWISKTNTPMKTVEELMEKYEKN